jgi:dTDP-4-dehydrorhamnose reductase
LGVYGASKLAGEYAVLKGNPRSVVLRTAWVVSRHRNNFVKTMLRLAADRERLGVVDDQTGCPTSAKDIAEALKVITLKMIGDDQAPCGIYNFVNQGSTTWAGLAREVFGQSAAVGGPEAQVDGIPTEAYPTPARRPGNSRLSTLKIQADYDIHPRPWQEAIAEIVGDLMKERGQ